jgi:hypothetical protein
MSYIVTSDLEVCGKKKGEALTEKDLVGLNVEALIGAGHVSGSASKPVTATEGATK